MPDVAIESVRITPKTNCQFLLIVDLVSSYKFSYTVSDCLIGFVVAVTTKLSVLGPQSISLLYFTKYCFGNPLILFLEAEAEILRETFVSEPGFKNPVF